MKAAIFDMDGTLAATLETHLASFMTVCERHGIGIEPDFVKIRFGMTAREIFEDIGKEAGLELDTKALADEKYAEYNKIVGKIKALPGAIKLMKALKKKGLKIGIATGAGRANFEATIKAAGLEGLADATATAEDGRGKPNPDLFLKAAEKLGVAPKDCVVFEDVIYGVRAAKKAGMRVIAVATGLTAKEDLEKENPDRMISSLLDIKPGEIIRWN